MATNPTYPTKIFDSDDLRQFLNVATDASTDVLTLIDNATAAAHSYIAEYLGQPVVPTDVTIQFTGNGTVWQMLNHFPVISISSLKYYETPLDTATAYVEGTDYKLTKMNSIYYIYFEDGFDTTGYYEATFKVGYSTIPKTIFELGIEIGSLLYKYSDATGAASGGRLGLATINETGIAGGAVLNTTFKDEFQRIYRSLGKYKLPII